MTRKTRPLRIAAFAILGVVLGYVLIPYLKRAGLSEMRVDDVMALFIAALYALATVVNIVVWFNPKSPNRAFVTGWSILGSGLVSVLMAAPVLLPATAYTPLIYAAIVALFALQTAANIMLLRRADELLRQLTADATVAAFWTINAVLFLYAAAERMGLAGGVTAWGMMSVWMLVHYVASSWAVLRRGLGEPMAE